MLRLFLIRCLDSGLSTITRDDQDELIFPSTSSLASPVYNRETGCHEKLSPAISINQDDSRCSSVIAAEDDLLDIPGIKEITGPGESLYNLIFIGDMAVGKTALIYRLAQNQFLVNLCSTVGVDFHVKSYCVDNSKKITVQLWDTGGQERLVTESLQFIQLYLILI